MQRFVPSGFGAEEDRIKPLAPFEALLEKKMKIRREIEAAGIPYTSVSANCCAAYFVNYLLRPYEEDVKNIVVYGNGEAKGIKSHNNDH